MGSPTRGLADFVVMEGCLGVPPVWQPQGLGALPGDVGKGLVWLAMSLQQPLPWGYHFWGGGGVSKSSPAPTPPAADRAAFHQLPRQRRWPCQEHSAPCSSPADTAL